MTEVRTAMRKPMVEDGDSTDAESNSSDDDLNVHNFVAELEAALEEEDKNRADLDHMDSMALPASAEDGEAAQKNRWTTWGRLVLRRKAARKRRMKGNRRPKGPPWPPSSGKARLCPPPPAPGAMRLNGKRRPAAAYLAAGVAWPSQKVLKRPAMLKRPAGKIGPWPNEECKGHAGASCQFNPTSPGEPARVQPGRGVHHCLFCRRERTREAHAAPRRGTRFAYKGLRAKRLLGQAVSSLCIALYSMMLLRPCNLATALSSILPWRGSSCSSARQLQESIAKRQSPRKRGSHICCTESQCDTQ